jgi:hypothetical protein
MYNSGSSDGHRRRPARTVIEVTNASTDFTAEDDFDFMTPMSRDRRVGHTLDDGGSRR